MMYETGSLTIDSLTLGVPKRGGAVNKNSWKRVLLFFMAISHPIVSKITVNNHKLTTAAENPSPEASPMPTSTPTGMKPSILSTGWRSPKNS